MTTPLDKYHELMVVEAEPASLEEMLRVLTPESPRDLPAFKPEDSTYDICRAVLVLGDLARNIRTDGPNRLVFLHGRFRFSLTASADFGSALFTLRGPTAASMVFRAPSDTGDVWEWSGCNFEEELRAHLVHLAAIETSRLKHRQRENQR